MNMVKLKTLSDILSTIDDIDCMDSLYIDKHDKYINLSTKCAILDADETEDPEGETHNFAKENQLKYCLQISHIQDIKDNALEQKEQISIDELYRAFVFYFRNDAFIEF